MIQRWGDRKSMDGPFRSPQPRKSMGGPFRYHRKLMGGPFRCRFSLICQTRGTSALSKFRIGLASGIVWHALRYEGRGAKGKITTPIAEALSVPHPKIKA